MTIIEAATEAATNGAQLIRERKDSPRQYDVKPIFTGSKKGWTMLDSFTASAIVAVGKALSDENRAKYNALALPKLITVTWKLVK